MKQTLWVTVVLAALVLSSSGCADYLQDKLAGPPSANEAITAQEQNLSQLRSDAEQGHAEAQYRLGYLSYMGRGVSKDFAKARKWYLKAADQGNADAQNYLGRIYHHGLGVPPDWVEARSWYLKAAEQGHFGAQFELGNLYSQGQGVAQDYVEARKWYFKAAEQGIIDAYLELGHIYEDGEGVAQDYVMAYVWYSLAASQDDLAGEMNRDHVAGRLDATSLVEAQRLSTEYFKLYVEPRVARDYAEALKWFLKNAEQGIIEAQLGLGHIYEDGEGVAQDYVMAYVWYSLAASQDDLAGEMNRDHVAGRLDATSLVEAQRLSTEYFKLYVEPFQ